MERGRTNNEAIINEVRAKSSNEGSAQGITQGIAQNCKEMVLNMHKDNLSLDLIAKYANLTIEEVKEIIDNNLCL